MKKITLLFLMLTLCNIGYSQVLDCTDYQIIHIQDSIVWGNPCVHFKMTTNNNTFNSGYSDFVFIDQTGDTITAPTHWSMWLPDSNNTMFDTTSYVLNLKLGITSFPSNFNGHLEIKNPDCIIPFNYSALSTPSINEEIESINIYPNPTIDKLYISGISPTKIDYIQIYNINGKLMSVNMSLNNYIDISNITQGVYFVKIYSNYAYKTFKIIKNDTQHQ